jgi:hypothetical protein
MQKMVMIPSFVSGLEDFGVGPIWSVGPPVMGTEVDPPFPNQDAIWLSRR